MAQSAPPDLAKEIQHQIRFYYNIPPEVHLSVGAPSTSPEFPSYQSVLVTIDGATGAKQNLTLLISKDHSSMKRMIDFDLRRDPFAETMNKINTSGRPTRGAKGAKVVLVSFDDFECPWCSRLHQTLFPEILKEYGDRVTFIYKDYPMVQLHPWAMHAAVDANCLAAQNNGAYWDFADTIHANQSEVNAEKASPDRLDAIDRLTFSQVEKYHLDQVKLRACVKAQDESSVQASMKEAESVGVEATPTLFINGERLNGAVPIGRLRAALDNALADLNPTVITPHSK